MKFIKIYLAQTALTALLVLSMISFLSCSTPKQAAKNQISAQTKVANTSLMIDAKRAEFKNDLPEAIELLAKILKTDPDNHAAMHELARIYQYSNRDKAIVLSEKACSIDANNKWYLQHLATLYTSDNQHDKAAKVLMRIIDLDPSNKQNYFNLANSYIDSKDWARAIKTYQLIEVKFGYDRNIILQRKQIYLKKGDFDAAIKELKLLITREPENKDIHGMIAEIYHSQGKVDDAMFHFQEILKIDPDDGKVRLSLADFYKSQGQTAKEREELIKAMISNSLDIDSKIAALLKVYEKSNTDFELRTTANIMLEALRVSNPDNPKTMAMNADFLFREGKKKEALDFYLKAIEKDSTRFLIWEQVVFIQMELKDYSSAEKNSKKALIMFSQNPNLFYANGYSNYMLGKHQEARAALMIGQNFVYSKERKVDFMRLIAILHDSLGDTRTAQIYFDKAMTISPLNSSTLEAYSWFLLEQNKFEEAKLMAIKLVEIEMENDAYIYLLAKIFQAEGNLDESAKWIESGLGFNPRSKILLKLYSDHYKLKGDEAKSKYYLDKYVE